MKSPAAAGSRSPLFLLGAVIVLVVLYSMLPSGEVEGHGGLRNPGSRLKAIPARTEFLIVSDLDKRSAIDGSKKPRWKAYLKKVCTVMSDACQCVG